MYLQIISLGILNISKETNLEIIYLEKLPNVGEMSQLADVQTL